MLPAISTWPDRTGDGSSPSHRGAETAAQETRLHHRLGAFHCPIADAACVAETAAWRHRAESWLKRFAESEARFQRIECLQSNNSTSRSETGCSLEACVELARNAERLQRFSRYQLCLSTYAGDEVKSLPLVGLRRLDKGWFFLSGLRGHYHFCDGVWAYDLETGAAYELTSCGDLAILPGGTVDRRATDGARRAHIKTGHVSVDALREAVWFALQSEDLDTVESGAFPAMAADIEPVRERDAVSRVSSSRVFTTSSGDSQLAWRYHRNGLELASGTLTWPGGTQTAENDYLIELIRFTEKTEQPDAIPTIAGAR